MKNSECFRPVKTARRRYSFERDHSEFLNWLNIHNTQQCNRDVSIIVTIGFMMTLRRLNNSS